MIYNLKNKRPKIYFKEQKKYIMVEVNTPVKIYSKEPFNSSFTMSLDVTFTKINDYEFEFTPTTTGWHTINLEAATKDLRTITKSNSLLVVAIPEIV